MIVYENDLVIVESGNSTYIGKANLQDSRLPEYIVKLNLKDAFKIITITALTPEGMMIPTGSTMGPIIHNYEKPIEIYLNVNSIVKVDKKMPIYKTYEMVMAKCSGIILADANAINNIKQIKI